MPSCMDCGIISEDIGYWMKTYNKDMKLIRLQCNDCLTLEGLEKQRVMPAFQHESNYLGKEGAKKVRAATQVLRAISKTSGWISTKEIKAQVSDLHEEYVRAVLVSLHRKGEIERFKNGKEVEYRASPSALRRQARRDKRDREHGIREAYGQTRSSKRGSTRDSYGGGVEVLSDLLGQIDPSSTDSRFE